MKSIFTWLFFFSSQFIVAFFSFFQDNEKRNSSLQLLHENTQYYSSSQHVILTPQAIDPRVWQNLHVPVFCMRTPKRSLQ